MKIEYRDALRPEGDFEGNQKAQQDAVVDSVTALMENGFCFKGTGVDSSVNFLSINLLLHITYPLFRAKQETFPIHASLV